MSEVALNEGNVKGALRYALAGAVVHPYGFVRASLTNLIRQCQPSDELARTIGALWRGKAEPFKWTHRLMKRLENNDGEKAAARIEENLRRAGIPPDPFSTMPPAGIDT